MKPSYKILVFVSVILLAALATGMVLADDGTMFRRDVSKTPDGETEKAAMAMMGFYVPVQSSDGTVGVPIEYYDAEGALVDTRDYAKPLISVYIDGVEPEVPEFMSYAVASGVGFGHRDAFSALSLDDGATWKRTNLSDTALLSSFVLSDGHEYPGDVHYMTFAVAGDRVLAGWLSKYCASGTPGYTLEDEVKDALVTEYGLPDMYLEDLFGVAGSQGSVDYTLQGFPEVGEVPYSCVWTARGKLVEVDADGLPTEGGGFYDVLWSKAERLTSGRRDANRLEVAAEPGAGFVMVWQEDPEGLRPGQGLGPGEGWSGAIVNQKTDVWYSYLSWDHFDELMDDEELVSGFDDFAGTTKPKAVVPFSMPIRMTDNNMCKGIPKTDTYGDVIDQYCYVDFDTLDADGFVDLPDTLPTGPTGDSDLCATQVQWTNPGGTTLDLCVAEDGRVMQGRNGSSRARFDLRAYDSDGDGANDSAWVVLAYEELKALGEGASDDPEAEPLDIGKNIWYHSFDMFHPDIAAQGGMLNQPAIDPETGIFFPQLTDEFGNLFYETEIARRFNLMTQTPEKAGESGTVGMLIYKQGIINQGGPADIFLRPLVLPEGFDPQTDNPYAFENITCDNWDFDDGSNPRYLQGVCLDPAINVSATNIVACDNGTSGEACADLFPWDGGETYPKVVEWSQDVENLDDQAWENPYDVAKGHRGFIDGDFIMMMYAWAPNWKANTVGNDHYNLYVRRSFDGGLTWTTTPAALGGDGTETCEYYGHGSDVEEICTTYGAGEFEQARNVSQLVGNKITVLDPRYSPSGGPRMFTEISTDYVGAPAAPYEDDIRDPSMFFIVYETGDNTTVAEGEAVPLDLFYSRAYDWGDDYDYVEYFKDKDGDGIGETVLEWDWLENKQDDLSGEANVTANPGATYFYAVWNQWQEPEEDVIENSDMYFRRVMYLDDVDAEPSGSILYASALAIELGDELTLIGSARDNDHLGDGPGIVEYAWYVDDQTEPAYTGKDWKFRVQDMKPGVHTFGFAGKDNEGNWSGRSTVNVLVVEELHILNLPIMARP